MVPEVNQRGAARAVKPRFSFARVAALDGFRDSDKDPFGAYSGQSAERLYGVVRAVARQIGATLEGLERLPAGRALLVANHTFGYDVMFPMAEILARCKRSVWVLGDHLWWKLPFVRRLVASVGVVDGTSENVDRLLARDELVLVLPGGLREAVKPRELRYQLLWGRRYGFVEAAIRNRAPLVPLAMVGADDLFDFMGNAYSRGARWLRLPQLPIPLPSRILPIPHRTKLRFIMGEPIVPDVQPEQASDPKALRRLRREVAGALHELIEDELARRAGIQL